MREATASGTALGSAQRKIFMAFIDLINEKSIDKITISELCEKAEVNRSTFYRYYYDIYDLHEKMQDYSVESIISFCSNLDFGLTKEHDGVAMINDGIPKYTDEISIAIMRFSVRDETVARKIYDRLMQAVPALLRLMGVRVNRQITDVLGFVLNGAIFYCIDNVNSFDIRSFYEIAKISIFSFKKFVERFAQSGRIETPLTDKNMNESPERKRERLSIMKTKRSLKRAFSELMKEKSADKITVSELCKKAEISHSTFYNHFGSIDDFIVSMKNEIISGFLDISKKVYDRRGSATIGIKELISFAEKNKQFVFGMRESSHFREQLFKFPKQFAESFYELIDSAYNCDFDKHTAFYFTCYCAWSSLFQPYGEESMPASQVMNLAYSMFTDMFKAKKSKN